MNIATLMLFAQIAAAPPTAAIRINQLGYLPDAPKVAVFCSLAQIQLSDFAIMDAKGTTILRSHAIPARSFGPCSTIYRLDFSSLTKPGGYRIVAAGITSPAIRVRKDAYAGAADTLLYYMREQRSGYNPLFKTVVHTHDGVVVDDPVRAGKFVPV